MKAFFCLPAAAVLFICSCKKEPAVQQILPGNATAQFSIGRLCQNYLLPGTIQPIDSTVVFTNMSLKTGIINPNEVMSYSWNFGDNIGSNATSPLHSYSRSGNYSVRLIVFLNGQPMDTATQNIRIIIGQKEIKPGMAYNDAIDIAETTGNGALILVQSYDINFLNRSYSLIKVDSVLKQEWIKPLGGTNIRLNSIRQVSATEYILSGNLTAGNTNQFAVSKIDNLGNLVWTKYVAGMQGTNTFTIPSAGGFISVGTVMVAGYYHPAVVKLNAAGDETWRNVLSGNPWYADPANILETGSGYVFAARSLLSNNRILLTQLNPGGTIIRQDSILTTSLSSPFSTGISYTGNTFMVYGIGANTVYLLDNNFVLQASKEIVQYQITDVQAGANIFYVAQSGGQYGSVKAITPNGTENWHHTIDNIISISCSSFMMGATRRCKKVIYTSAGEIIALSEGQNDPNGGPSSSAYVVKLWTDGSVK